MKDNEKKVKVTEEVKEDAKTEEEGVQLTDEELAQVVGGEIEKFQRTKPYINIDTIGHVDYGKVTLTVDINKEAR